MNWSRLFKILDNPVAKKIYVGFTYVCAVIPDKPYLKLLYRIRTGSSLDLKNPSTFNEKIQYLKLYEKKVDHSYMTDKVRVRDYVCSRIGEEHLIPVIGVYNRLEDIDIDSLPEEFVIKCTHDSGSVVICHGKEDLLNNRARLKNAQKRKYYLSGREYSYKGITPKFIIEQKLVNDETKGLRDYKFYCFGGEPRYLYISEGLQDHSTAAISFFDLDMRRMPFHRADYRELDYDPVKPAGYDEMIEISRKLSAGHPFVRVDLYEVDGHVYFSELTFTPCSGYMPFEPKEYDRKLGEELRLLDYM